MKKILDSLRRRRARLGAEAGQIVVISAFLLPVLLGFGGMAIDVGTLMTRRTSQQRAADASALAAAEALYWGLNSTQAKAQATDYGSKHGYPSGEMTVNHPPSSGPYSGDSDYVEVIIETTAPTLLIRVLGVDDATVKARAVAGIRTVDRPYALIVLDKTQCQAYKQTGTSNLTINNGAAIVNSSCANPEASYWDGSSITTTAGFDYYKNGKWNIFGNSAVVNPAPSPVRSPIDDPLADLQRPVPCSATAGTPSGCIPQSSTSVGTAAAPVMTTTTGSWCSGANCTFQPGTYYGGLKIEGNKNVTFQPGLYVFAGGTTGTSGGDPNWGFVYKNGTLSGSGVTFFSTGDPYATSVAQRSCGPLFIRGASTVNLSAPNSLGTPLDDEPVDSGDLNNGVEDMLFWMDDSCTDMLAAENGCPAKGFSYQGGSNYTASGIFYSPNNSMEIAGGGAVNSAIQVIVSDYCYRGSTPFSINYTGYIPTGVPRVWLAE